MTAVSGTKAPTGPGWRGRVGKAAPYILLAPGLIFLILFFVIPAIQMFTYSISTGSVEEGFKITWTLDAYREGLETFGKQFLNSIIYGGIATILCLFIGFPVAYTIAFRGGRYKNLILFLVIAPFFTSFLIRTISWKILLGDEGPIFGITYNFLRFMILPLYVALEKIDPRLLEAGADLFGSPAAVFRRITIPLALPGIFAGTLLTFIPAMGDYINAELLGNPNTRMIGNVIQNRLLVQNDYPVGSALSFILMAGILVAVAVYAKLLGTEQLTG